MSYKVYNELPKMGTDAKALISMIYYMYNVTKKETPGTGAKVARVQPSTPDTIEAPGAGAKVARAQPSTPDTIEAPGWAQTKKPTAKRPPVPVTN